MFPFDFFQAFLVLFIAPLSLSCIALPLSSLLSHCPLHSTYVLLSPSLDPSTLFSFLTFIVSQIALGYIFLYEESKPNPTNNKEHVVLVSLGLGSSFHIFSIHLLKTSCFHVSLQPARISFISERPFMLLLFSSYCEQKSNEHSSTSICVIKF